MKSVIVGIAVLFFLPLAFGSNEQVQLTPGEPYPSENLLCRYLDFEQGNVVEFIWKVNDEVKDWKVIDKPSSIFNGEKKKNDVVRCEINLLDPATLQRNVYVGMQSVTVGRYECNDGLDNEGDGFIDARDDNCATRTAPSEGVGMAITPKDPYPSENLLCKFLYWNENDVLEFAWFVNDMIQQRRVVDKPSTIFSKQTARNDKVRCEVYHYDPSAQRRGNTIGIEEVTVGRFACNDGRDNDNDGFIDAQDIGCSSRQGKSEFRIEIGRFCENHPENLFCVGLGLREVNDLCVRNLNNNLCQQEMQNEAFERCAGNEESVVCRGVDEITTYCQDHREEAICRIFLTTILQCQEQQRCYELTQENKEFLCLLRPYSFCPSQEVPPAGNGPVGDERVGNEQPKEQPQEQPRQQRSDGEEVSLPPLQPPQQAPENESRSGPPQLLSICGDKLCEKNEEKNCPKDCINEKDTPVDGTESWWAAIAIGIVIIGGAAAYWTFGKKKKRR